MTEPIVDLLAEEWASIHALGAGLTPPQWQTVTDCPGWTVQDQLSHLIGTETMLLGRPADPPTAPVPHVRNDIGALNEAAIDARRARPGGEVLAEFAAVTAERLAALRALAPEAWDVVGPSPVGPVPYREFMRVRVFDCWAHEQDIRRAVGQPGHLRGPIVDLVLAWHRRNLGYVVGKRAGASEGTAVRFLVRGAADSDSVLEDVTVTVVGGRATALAPADAPPPTSTIDTDVETYNALLCGRWSAEHAQRAGRVRIAGDPAPAQAVLDAAGYVF